MGGGGGGEIVKKIFFKVTKWQLVAAERQALQIRPKNQITFERWAESELEVVWKDWFQIGLKDK